MRLTEWLVTIVYLTPAPFKDARAVIEWASLVSVRWFGGDRFLDGYEQIFGSLVGRSA